VCAEDHKPNAPAEAERIRAAGGFVSANRVDGQLAMSRAIGDWSYKGDTNLHVTKQKVIAVPEITVQTAEEGDSLLVCCDGIVEQMKNEDAAQFIHSELSTPNANDPVRTKQITRSTHPVLTLSFFFGCVVLCLFVRL
jgi:serine/threonine protein phosphatase PrpC